MNQHFLNWTDAFHAGLWIRME